MQFKHIFVLILNETGSCQVGAISKAQKSSRNNYWKHLQKISFFSKKIFLKFFFSKKISLSRTMPKNSKRGYSGSLNVFTNRKLQKNARGYPLIESETIQKKSHTAEKNKQKKPNDKNFWSRMYFWKYKKICGSLRESISRSPAFQKISWTNEKRL